MCDPSVTVCSGTVSFYTDAHYTVSPRGNCTDFCVQQNTDTGEVRNSPETGVFCNGDLGDSGIWTHGPTGITPVTEEFLSSYAESQLPSYPPFTSDSGSDLAALDVSLSSSTCDLSNSKYKFKFQVPQQSSTFIISWTFRFTPDGGASPTDVSMSYTFDGTVPPGYDPNDDTTWPETPVYIAPTPPYNGIYSIVGLSSNCVS